MWTNLRDKERTYEGRRENILISEIYEVPESNVRYCHAKMFNTSQEHIQLGKNMLIDTAEDLQEGIKSSEALRPCGRVNTVGKMPLRTVSEIRKIFQEKLSHLSNE
jgi:hypothetical protein